MYKVQYILPSEIGLYEQEWRCLEEGKDMTYFQTFNWYKSIKQFVLNDTWLNETRIAIVLKEDTVILFAPIFVIKHNFFLSKKGVYFWGRCGWSDYLNLIYKNFDSRAFEYLVQNLKLRYHVSNLYLEQVKESTMLYKYLKTNSIVISEKRCICVALQIPENANIYNSSLSKGTRQNLRTAVNRLNKEGHTLRFVFDDTDVDLKLCEEMRAVRVFKKNKPKNILSCIKQFLLKHTSIKYNYGLPFYFDKASKMMVAYEGDKPRAFFNYGINKVDKSIVLMAVGTDESFQRYSPGMLLMYNFILGQINQRSIQNVDFTRGTERYKYALGGKEHSIYNFKMKL